jgi:hypothetical protein
VATNDSSGTSDEAVEGSWSPRRSKASSTRTTPKADDKGSGDKGSGDKGASPDTEVLAQEIEQTREELAETLDAIAEKVSPKRVVARNKKAAKDGAKDAVEVVKEGAASAAETVKGTAASAAETVKGGVASVKEKVTGDSDPVRSPLTPATSVEVGAASPLSDDTVSLSVAEVPVEPAPTPGALADAAVTVTEPAGGETPSYPVTLPPATPSRTPVYAGAGAALLVLLLLLKRRRR